MPRNGRRSASHVTPVALALAFGAAVLACADQDAPALLAPDAEVLESQHGGAPAAIDRNFRAHLTGAEEVPAVETAARGQAIFQLSRDGTELSYRLIVANIENVTMAHIHQAPAGVNGPVVVWLYPDAPPPQLIEGRFSGVLATGSITAADLVGQLEGEPLSVLVDLIRAGETYVNVHTSQFPPGEVRGQIR